MSFLDEFKTFAMRGNAIDMAVGIVIGAAFGKIVSSLVTDIIMPPIGYVLGEVDFSKLAVTLKPGEAGKEAVAIKYGTFINSIIDFVIIAFVIFLLIKLINQIRGEQPIPEATTTKCPECLMEIPIHAKKCGHCSSDIWDNKDPKNKRT